MRTVLICWFFVMSAFPVSAADLPAFPGAEGFGADTSGGRGGRIIEVTNLNDSGPGSFRAACESKGRRIIVFRTGGTIRLKRNINLSEPFVTIAGQTAPGDGICLGGGGLYIHTHDVVVRYLRVRVGDAPEGPDPDNRDGISIASLDSPPHHVIVDHCSISWGIDETCSMWYPCHDITFQWCIISEGLHNSLHPKGAHSMGLLVGSGPVNGTCHRISIHHCLMAHNAGRNPLVSGDSEVEIVNNVIYDWMWGAGTHLGNCSPEFPLESRSLCNLIGNYYKRGPSTRSSLGNAVVIDPCWNERGGKVYIHDNIGWGRLTNQGDNWLIALNRAGDRVRSNQPALEPSGITIQPVLKARDAVLKHAGATQPRRDAVDTRVVKDVKSGTGKIIDSQKEVGGWPELNSGTPPADADHDGMPDAWETGQGLDHHDDKDRNQIASSGYTWIEEYLNSLVAIPQQ